ncbi:MAG: hypothetical protein ACOC2C_02020 [Cyclonatronaceae bacterium]
MSLDTTSFHVVAIPLNRPEIIRFLMPPEPSAVPKGASIDLVNQRPNLAAEARWAAVLAEDPSPENLLLRDRPESYLAGTSSDRLVPIEFLQQDEAYLSRNLGGWAPVFFGVMRASETAWKSDPLLKNAVIMKTYGPQIQFSGGDPRLVLQRLETEFGCSSIAEIAQAINRLYSWRDTFKFMRSVKNATAYAGAVYAELVNNGKLMQPDSGRPGVPRALLIDELLGQLVRHRCSTVLIAPELGIVAKQPGPEPYHEAKLNAVEYAGKFEHRPQLIRDGSLVSSAGRLRLILEEGLIERLNHLFYHDVKLISTLGFIIEPFVSGPTLQEYVLEKPDRLTPEVYDFIVLHQQVCESMGVENGDWHAANFMVMPGRENPIAPELPRMIHIDWGAARPLEPNEYTDAQIRARLNQVQNIAYSYHNEALAGRSRELHRELMESPQRLEALRRKADRLVEGKG